MARLVSILLVLLCGQSFAATLCVGPSATGNGSGSNWTNLLAWSSSPARGDTWYLVDGSYSGKTFSTALSGTTLITIKKATVADHGGIATGWVDTLGDGQAVFSSTIEFDSGYWTFDGVRGDNFSRVPTDYGFAFVNNLENPIALGNRSVSTDNMTISHVAATGPTANLPKIFVEFNANSVTHIHCNNLNVNHCYMSTWANGIMTSCDYGITNVVFEYNVCLNLNLVPGGEHGEWINNNWAELHTQIIRFNIFDLTSGTPQTGVIVANNNDTYDVQVYGNVFDSQAVANGIITSTSAGTIHNLQCYNNTFINCTIDVGPGCWFGGYPITGSAVSNNLIYNMAVQSCTSAPVEDYNAFYSCSSPPSESHGQIASGNPFTNLAGNDYSLLANTSGGKPLAAAYSTDLFGNPRTTWTRGAIEFGSSPGPVPPSITGDLSNITAGTNTTATFTVTAVGDAPLSYFWFTNLVLAWSTSNSLIFPAVTPSLSNTLVQVTVSNSLGTAVSSAVHLYVTNAFPVIITGNPVDVACGTNTIAAFSVTAAGDAPITYRWNTNGVRAGSTSNNIVFNPTIPAMSNMAIQAIVTNWIGRATSTVAHLFITNPPPPLIVPTISQDLTNITVGTNSTARFVVTASGTTPLAYQWATNSVATTSTSNSFVLSPTTLAMSNTSVRVVITNVAGSVTSAVAVLSVTNGLQPPVITGDLTNQTVLSSNVSAVFVVTATGDLPLSYRWTTNSVTAGGNSNSLVFDPVTAAMSNTAVQVIVTNSAGKATSSIAFLYVTNLPGTHMRILFDPPDITCGTNARAVFSILVYGTQPISYRWTTNGVPTTNTGDNIIFDPTTLAMSNTAIQCLVTNSQGTTNSRIAHLYVTNGIPIFPPVITFDVQDVVVGTNTTAVFSLTAVGDPTLAYSWTTNSVLAGSTSNSLVIPNTVLALSNTLVQCIVTNLSGSATSRVAKLWVTNSAAPPPPTMRPILISPRSMNFGMLWHDR